MSFVVTPQMRFPLGGGGLTQILPPSTDTAPVSLGVGNINVRTAIRSNILDALSASVAPTGNGPQPNVGQPGSANNAGQIAGAAGNLGYGVETFVRNFTPSNPTAAMVWRIGLPIVGVYLIAKDHVVWGGLAIAVSLPLWLNRLNRSGTITRPGDGDPDPTFGFARPGSGMIG